MLGSVPLYKAEQGMIVGIGYYCPLHCLHYPLGSVEVDGHILGSAKGGQWW